MRIPILLFYFLLFYWPTLSGQIPINGLVAFWRFNGDVLDESNNHLTTIPHNVTWTTDRFGQAGKALRLSGNHAYVEVPDHPAIHVQNFTYSFWLQVEETVGKDPFLISKRLDKPAERYSIAVYGRNSSMNTFVCDNVGNETYQRSSLWVPQLHNWHNITVTGDYSSLSYCMYLDGELAGRVDLNVRVVYDQNPLTIGVMKFHDVFGDFLKANFDDMRIYKRALTPEEVHLIAADRPGNQAIGTAWMKKDLPDGKYITYYTEKDKVIKAGLNFFDLKKRQPFWQNSWFIAGNLLLAFGLAIRIQHSRNQRKSRARKLELDKLKAVEQERSRIARDLHDDLGSGLSAIGLLTEIARQKSTDPGLNAEIQKMAATAHELSHKIRDIIWMVSARFDNLENLISYLNHYAVELFAESATNLQVQLPARIPAVNLGGEERRAFFNCIKTALQVLFTSAPSDVVLIFNTENPQRITIRYDGPDVFTAAIASSSNFSLMLQKMEETGSTFLLQQEGSLISLHFMLNRTEGS